MNVLPVLPVGAAMADNRIEGCPRMDEAWAAAQDGSIPRSGLRSKMAEIITSEVRSALRGMDSEEALQRKAHELSSGRRVVPALAAREAAATAFDLAESQSLWSGSAKN